MNALVEPLTTGSEVELAVVTASADPSSYDFTENNVRYFNIPQNKVLETYQLFRDRRLARYLDQAQRLIELWKPDVIHVHGSERFFGLVRARRHTDVPTVVSMQCVMSEYAKVVWGVLTWRDVLRNVTFYDLTRNNTPMAAERVMLRQAPLEREIIRGADAIIGRTAWDHAHVQAIDPNVRYFHVDEIMRPEFRAAQAWTVPGLDEAARRGVIMTTSTQGPLKGLPVLLEAVAILRSWGHPVRLKVAGVTPAQGRRNGLVHYLLKLIERLRIQDAVQMLGWADAEGLVSHIRASHCFVTPSFVENGCNALSEAQLVGIPCVATHAGGLTTTVRDEETGLLFSRQDSAMLARQIERILTDDTLAARIGANARAHAMPRHDPRKIVADLMDCYHTACLGRGGRNSQTSVTPPT
jgi:glycosyltransferase involved in cell wall biosynthesis